MKVVIYHNPRCTKSRQTLQLLQERGIEPEVVEYLKTPPSIAEIKRLLGLLDLSARELMRTKEAEYKEQGLDAADRDEDQLIAAMHATPKLIERPIVVVDDVRAAIGRPPENVLSLFE